MMSDEKAPTANTEAASPSAAASPSKAPSQTTATKPAAAPTAATAARSSTARTTKKTAAAAKPATSRRTGTAASAELHPIRTGFGGAEIDGRRSLPGRPPSLARLRRFPSS